MWRNADADQAGRLNKLRERLNQLDQIPTLADVAHLELTVLPAVDALLSPSDGALASTDARDWLALLRLALVQAAERAAHRLAELRQLAARCTELADIDYEFLYD